MRHDERGCGLSGPDESPLGLDASLTELEGVVEAGGPVTPTGPRSPAASDDVNAVQISTVIGGDYVGFFAFGSGAASSGWLIISGDPVVSLAYSVLLGSISTIPLSVITYSRMSLL